MQTEIPNLVLTTGKKRRRLSTGSSVFESDGESDYEREHKKKIKTNSWQSLEEELLKKLKIQNERVPKKPFDEVTVYPNFELVEDSKNVNFVESQPPVDSTAVLENLDDEYLTYESSVSSLDEAGEKKPNTRKFSFPFSVNKPMNKLPNPSNTDSVTQTIKIPKRPKENNSRRVSTTSIKSSRTSSDYSSYRGPLKFQSEVFNDSVFTKTQLPLSKLETELNQISKTLEKIVQKSYMKRSRKRNVLKKLIPSHLKLINEDDGPNNRGIALSETLKCDIDPGETVYSFKPLIMVYDNMLDNASHNIETKDASEVEEFVCSKCLTYVPNLAFQNNKITCSSCNMVHYCSSECMNGDTNHYIECEFFQANRRNVKAEHNRVIKRFLSDISVTERVALQLLSVIAGDDTIARQVSILTSHHESGCDDDISETDSEHSQSHGDQPTKVTMPLMQQEVRKIVSSYVYRFQRFLSNDTGLDINKKGKRRKDVVLENALTKIVYIVLVNATVLQNYYNEDIGQMFDPFFALINHSCLPNCTLVFENDTVYLKALTVIRPGEELVVNYCPVSQPTSIRKLMLKKDFFFDCVCNLCENPFDLWLPIQCPNCKQTLGGVQFNNELLDLNDDFRNCKMCDYQNIDFSQVGFQYSLIINYLKGVYSPREINLTPFEVTLCDLSRASSSEYILDNAEKKLFLGLFQTIVDSKSIPLYSWPIGILASSLSRWYKAKYSQPQLNQLRFTIIDLIGTESLDLNPFRSSMGMKLYEILIVYRDFLEKVLDNKNLIRDESSELDGKMLTVEQKYSLAYAGLVITIQCYKYLGLVYSNHSMVPMFYELQMIAKSINELVIKFGISEKPLTKINNEESKRHLFIVCEFLQILPVCGELYLYNDSVMDTYIPIQESDLVPFDMTLS